MPVKVPQIERYVVLIAALYAVVACGDRDKLYPFYEFDAGADTESDTETPGDDSDSDTESDSCVDNFVDDDGRCIRYVNLNSNTILCGETWLGAFDNVQDGIDSAYAAAQLLNYCEVWVARGTYRPYVSDVSDTIKLRGNVHVFGGFAGAEHLKEERDIVGNETILDGRQDGGSAAVYHVVSGAQNAGLDGFTVTGGEALGPSPHHRGGGAYLNAASTDLRNCVFQHNRAVDGGGVFAWDSTPTIQDCSFTDNHAQNGGALFVLNGLALLDALVITNNIATQNGGGIYLDSQFGSCNPTLRNLTIEDNVAWQNGGGIYNRNCSATMDTTLISNNTAYMDGGGLAGFRGQTFAEQSIVINNQAGGDGGGVASNDNETVFEQMQILYNTADGNGGGVHLEWSEGTFASCLVAGNTAQGNGGGFAIEMDFPRIVNTRVNGNRATRGGGFYNGTRGDPNIVNTVINGNLADDSGGAIFNAELSETEVVNCIAWDNGATEIVDEPGSSTTVSYCDVMGGYPGSFIIDLDPVFVSPGHWDDLGTIFDPTDDQWVIGDYHIEISSPCIDVSDDTLSAAYDADGIPWDDIVGVGLPGVDVDMGAYDYQP